MTTYWTEVLWPRARVSGHNRHALSESAHGREAARRSSLFHPPFHPSCTPGLSMNPLLQVSQHGQQIWLDNLSRTLLRMMAISRVLSLRTASPGSPPTGDLSGSDRGRALLRGRAHAEKDPAERRSTLRSPGHSRRPAGLRSAVAAVPARRRPHRLRQPGGLARTGARRGRRSPRVCD